METNIEVRIWARKVIQSCASLDHTLACEKLISLIFIHYEDVYMDMALRSELQNIIVKLK